MVLSVDNNCSKCGYTMCECGLSNPQSMTSEDLMSIFEAMIYCGSDEDNNPKCAIVKTEIFRRMKA